MEINRLPVGSDAPVVVIFTFRIRQRFDKVGIAVVSGIVALPISDVLVAGCVDFVANFFDGADTLFVLKLKEFPVAAIVKQHSSIVGNKYQSVFIQTDIPVLQCGRIIARAVIADFIIVSN